jgi:hypothetical protein
MGGGWNWLRIVSSSGKLVFAVLNMRYLKLVGAFYYTKSTAEEEIPPFICIIMKLGLSLRWTNTNLSNLRQMLRIWTEAKLY